MFVHSPKPRESASRRRYYSHINSQQAIELRRVKKQKVERARRARISDKMVELHALALSMAGQEAESSVRMEKAEMLNFCCEVLSGLHKLLEENPEVKTPLQTSHSGGSATTAAVRHGFVSFLISDSISNSASTSTSASAFTTTTTTTSVSTSRITSCDTGVHELPASPTLSLVQPSSIDYNSVNPTNSSAQAKRSRAIWRPSLNCL
ncbi:Basic helix loop helix dimerisation region bHLH [Echinococcus multilocularis]|uniref:Basic helix loop helix dimerisation region bHLH n=1 Tax=Echinococcus multilocularis TaxID=6211 RepID=A0A087VZ10_ECHMU|nr:Basic helix loop helix dimerisation region bHLH [Echinococcus multilocularis]